MTPDPDTEARLDALERTVKRWSNPGHLTTSEAVSLKEYFEAKLLAQERATEVATNAMDRRLAGMNEFRDTLRDQAARFVTRDETSALLAPIKAQLDTLQTFKDQLQGKASAGQAYLAIGLSIVSVAMAFIGLFLR